MCVCVDGESVCVSVCVCGKSVCVYVSAHAHTHITCVCCVQWYVNMMSA